MQSRSANNTDFSHVAEIEKLFADFAYQNSLTIQKETNDLVELHMRIRQQPGLSFDIQLAYSDDIFFIVAGEHTGEKYIIENDYHTAWNWAREIVAGLVNGNCRVVEYRQRGRIRKTAFEKKTDSGWSPISTRYSPFLWPFLQTNPRVLINAKR
jgi:hypothetical protein